MIALLIVYPVFLSDASALDWRNDSKSRSDESARCWFCVEDLVDELVQVFFATFHALGILALVLQDFPHGVHDLALWSLHTSIEWRLLDPIVKLSLFDLVISRVVVHLLAGLCEVTIDVFCDFSDPQLQRTYQLRLRDCDTCTSNTFR